MHIILLLMFKTSQIYKYLAGVGSLAPAPRANSGQQIPVLYALYRHQQEDVYGSTREREEKG